MLVFSSDFGFKSVRRKCARSNWDKFLDQRVEASSYQNNQDTFVSPHKVHIFCHILQIHITWHLHIPDRTKRRVPRHGSNCIARHGTRHIRLNSRYSKFHHNGCRLQRRHHQGPPNFRRSTSSRPCLESSIRILFPLLPTFLASVESLTEASAAPLECPDTRSQYWLGQFFSEKTLYSSFVLEGVEILRAMFVDGFSVVISFFCGIVFVCVMQKALFVGFFLAMSQSITSLSFSGFS